MFSAAIRYHFLLYDPNPRLCRDMTDILVIKFGFGSSLCDSKIVMALKWNKATARPSNHQITST